MLLITKGMKLSLSRDQCMKGRVTSANDTTGVCIIEWRYGSNPRTLKEYMINAVLSYIDDGSWLAVNTTAASK